MLGRNDHSACRQTFSSFCSCMPQGGWVGLRQRHHNSLLGRFLLAAELYSYNIPSALKNKKSRPFSKTQRSVLSLRVRAVLPYKGLAARFGSLIMPKRSTSLAIWEAVRGRIMRFGKLSPFRAVMSVSPMRDVLLRQC